MKKFFKLLLSDSNAYSTKRVIGFICLLMFVMYGISGIIVPFNQSFWIFYISLCTITIWIAFKFMSAEKILKYDVIGKLTKFNVLKEGVDAFVGKEDEVDGLMTPEAPLDVPLDTQISGSTENLPLE